MRSTNVCREAGPAGAVQLPTILLAVRAAASFRKMVIVSTAFLLQTRCKWQLKSALHLPSQALAGHSKNA